MSKTRQPQDLTRGPAAKSNRARINEIRALQARVRDLVRRVLVLEKKAATR